MSTLFKVFLVNLLFIVLLFIAIVLCVYANLSPANLPWIHVVIVLVTLAIVLRERAGRVFLLSLAWVLPVMVAFAIGRILHLEFSMTLEILFYLGIVLLSSPVPVLLAKRLKARG